MAADSVIDFYMQLLLHSMRLRTIRGRIDFIRRRFRNEHDVDIM